MNNGQKTKWVIAGIDWENVRLTMVDEGHSWKSHPAEGASEPRFYSIERAFLSTLDWLKTIGEVALVAVFATYEQIYIHHKLWDSLGFQVHACPRDRDGKDSTDKYLQKWGETWVEHFEDLYCFCLGAGDADYSDLVKAVKRKNVKLAYVVGSEDSMSRVLRRTPDIHPEEGKKMVHIFSPI